MRFTRFIPGFVLSLVLFGLTSTLAAESRWWREFRADRAPFGVKREKAAFIGVSVTRMPEAMREHIKLPPGVGLLVEEVQPDSPAESAGIKRHDVLHKLNDQLLINEHQFRVLVRTYRPGDEVTLTVVRRGETKNITLRLAERELPVISDDWPLRLPDIRIDRDLDDILRNLPRPPRMSISRHGTGTMSVTTRDGTAQAHLIDDEHAIFLNVDRDGRKHLSAYALAGRQLFNGPVDTEEQRKGIPAEIADKVRRLERAIEEQRAEKSDKGGSAPVPRDRI